MSRRVVIFNVFGHRNTGDAMLLEALVDLLLRYRPAGDIEGIAFDPASERRWMPEIRWHERVGNKATGGLAGKILQFAALPLMAAIAASRLFLPLRRLLPADQRSAIEALDGAELAISCPGGYLEDSNSAYLLNLLQMLIARRLARKTVLAPQSVGPVRSRFGRAALAFTLRRMDAVYVREEPSLACAREAVGTAAVPVRSAGDLAFWYARRKEAGLADEWARLGIDPSQPVVGMTVVEWNFPHHPDPEAAQRSYLGSLAALIGEMKAQGFEQIVLFNQVASDLPVAESLAALAPGVVVDRFERDSGVFAAMIAHCELFVGSRFHSCIFALLGAVPTLAVAYLPKTSGIMADLGLGEFVLPIGEITPADLSARYARLKRERAEIARRLEQSVAEYRASTGSFVADLGPLLGAPAA